MVEESLADEQHYPPTLARPESLKVIVELIGNWSRVISLTDHVFVAIFKNQQVSSLRMLHEIKQATDWPIGHAPPAATQFVGEELITSHVGRHAVEQNIQTKRMDT